MNLSGLHTFLAIVETGSLVKASKQLSVTQSTVTTRLKSLEEELGQTLINRQKSGITLTTAGERMRRYANTMTELWRQAKQETALPDGIRFVCNIGCHPDLWPNLGEALFDGFRRTQFEAALSVWHGGQLELENWINTGLVDISLSYWATGHGNLEVHSLRSEKLILVSNHANCPIRVDPDYVFVEGGEAFGRAHAAAFADADTAKLSFGSASLGMQHILQHGGSAYLPKRIAQPHIETGKLFRLADAPEFSRQIYLLLNQRISQQISIDEFVTSVLEI